MSVYTQIDMLTDEAIARVDANADAAWKEQAYATGARLSRTMHTLTSDDIWLELDGQTHEPRAMGPVMRRLARDGYIRSTNGFVKSRSPKGHGHPTRVWECL